MMRSTRRSWAVLAVLVVSMLVTPLNDSEASRHDERLPMPVGMSCAVSTGTVVYVFGGATHGDLRDAIFWFAHVPPPAPRGRTGVEITLDAIRENPVSSALLMAMVTLTAIVCYQYVYLPQRRRGVEGLQRSIEEDDLE